MVFSLIEDCKFLLQILGNPTVRHVYREANFVADSVAKNAIFSANDVIILEHPPDGLYMSLLYDYMGCNKPRTVNSAK